MSLVQLPTIDRHLAWATNLDISPKAGVDVIWPTFLQGEIGNEARCYPLTHCTQSSWNPDNWKRSYILNGGQDWSQFWTVKTDSGVCASKRGWSISLFTLRSQIFCLKPCLLCIPVSPCPPSFLLPQTADTHTIYQHWYFPVMQIWNTVFIVTNHWCQ